MSDQTFRDRGSITTILSLFSNLKLPLIIKKYGSKKIQTRMKKTAFGEMDNIHVRVEVAWLDVVLLYGTVVTAAILLVTLIRKSNMKIMAGERLRNFLSLIRLTRSDVLVQGEGWWN
jgi:hypothetical protein